MSRISRMREKIEPYLEGVPDYFKMSRFRAWGGYYLIILFTELT